MSARPAATWLSALAVAASVTGACADTEPVEPAVEARELSGVAVSAVGDEVWVAGGLSGPAGSSPPVTSELPEGWGPNRSVVVFGMDGSLQMLLDVPLREEWGLGTVEVVADGANIHLLGTACPRAGFGCWPGAVEPVLFRLVDEALEPVTLDLPALPAPDEDAAANGGSEGRLRVVGQRGDELWVMQGTGQTHGYAGLADQYRLVRLDLSTGHGSVHPLESGLYGDDTVCSIDHQLYAAAATFVGDRLVKVRFLTRAMSADALAWQELAVWTGDLRPLGGGLVCFPAAGELVVSVSHGSPELHTIAVRADDGSIAYEGPGPTSTSAIVPIDDSGFGTSHDGTGGTSEVVRYLGAGHWEPTGVTVGRSPHQRIVVTDRAVLDVGALAERIYPDGGPAPEVLLELEE